MEHQPVFKEHRSGWGFAMRSLLPIHDDYAIVLDGFLESSHSWSLNELSEQGAIPYTYPWIGFMHNPPNIPNWFDYCHSPQIVLNRDIMQKSLLRCEGLYVLSEYCREWLSKQVNVPVNALIHPTEIPIQSGGPKRFTIRNWQFNANKKIIALGYFLRQMHSIKKLPTEKYAKLWLIPGERAKELYRMEASTMDTFDITIGDYSESDHVSNDIYDNLLSSNIAFVHLYDASACNSLIECIVRNTPILINPLPAVVERLGVDYPFYFDTLDEAARKVEDNKLILEAHQYLMSLDKKVYTQEYFLETFEQSEIYKGINDNIA